MSMKMRFGALILASVVVVAGWFGFVFRPAQARLSAVNADVQRTVDEVASLQAKLAELKKLEANETELREDAEKMMKALPADPKVSDFILMVQDAANESGIDFVQITPSLPAAPTTVAAPSTATGTAPAPSPSSSDESATAPVAPVAEIQTIAVQLTAGGGYFQMEDFVLKLEHLGRALRIDDFNVSSAEATTGGSPKLSVSLSMKVFMLNPQAAAASTATTTEGTS